MSLILKKKILILTTHPIQYHAPLFIHLTTCADFTIKVFYTSGNVTDEIYDHGFGKKRSWNMDLLNGYDYDILRNTSIIAHKESFFSISNPDVIDKIYSFNPDILLIFGWKHYSHLKVMRFFKGKIPIIFRGDSTTLDDDHISMLKIKLRYSILNWVYQNVDYVFSPGTNSDKYFIKSGLKCEQIIRAPHAVDNNWFSSFSDGEYAELTLLKSKLGINESNIVFLFAGKFISKKNPDILIEAFSHLAAEKDSVRLLIVGDGILETSIRKQIANFDYKVQKKIIMFPFQDQLKMKLFYRLASVYVLPSCGPGETWGLSVNEALACGTPVLVSDKSGCAADIVHNRNNGFVFESRNMIDLRQKLYWCSDFQNIRSLSKGTVDSLEKFSFTSFTSAIKKVIESIEN